MSIASELNRLILAKGDLATSIENKGVTVPSSSTLDEYPDLVDLIWQGEEVVPYDLEIEYLESTGTQWIDTETLFQIGTTVLINAVYTDNFDTTQVLAGPSANGGCWLGNVPYNSGSFAIADRSVIGRSNVRTSMILNYISGTTYLTNKNNGTHISGTRSANPTTNSIQLFGVSGNFLSSARIYSCLILDSDGNILRDFIPVRVGQVGYLYDRVSRTLFSNAGTGDFILGSDVEQKILPYDSKIEYLEATGTLWINTGVLYQLGMTILINAVYTSINAPTQVLAAVSDAGACWFGATNYNGGSFGNGFSSKNVINSAFTRTSVIFAYYSGKTVIAGNGNAIISTINNQPTTSLPVHLFGVGGSYLSSAKIYSCKIYGEHYNVLADFIPVRKGTVGYLYDKVSRTLFGNDGTGDFVLGPDVN